MATQDSAWNAGEVNPDGTPVSAFSRLNVNAPEFVPSFAAKPDAATNSNANASNDSPGTQLFHSNIIG